VSEPTVAEQIEQAQAEVPADTERGAKLAALTPEAAAQVLEDGTFEDVALTEADTELLAALTAPSSAQDDADDKLIAAADAALKAAAPDLKVVPDDATTDEGAAPEEESMDPNLDNPMNPKGEPPEMTEEEKAAQAEKVAQQNRQTLKNNRRAAKEWISKKTGRGVLVGQDPDGAVHCLVLGDEAQIATTDIEIDNDLYNLLLALILSHLPGSSVNSQVMHGQQMQALNNVANNLMAGLQATNNNVLELVGFLKLKFPELQSSAQPMGQTESGILIPKG
jgi:hypothetical protein